MEQNQRIEFTQRGLLITAQQYDPLVVGPMTVTGRWTFVTSNQHGDLLDVITRTDASNLSWVGFPQSGNSFQYNDNNAGPTININRVGVGSFTNLASAPINFLPGEVFDFTITDAGTNLTCSVVQVGGAGKSASISGTDSTNFSTDYLIFTNSRNSGDYVAYLDDVQISSAPVPEPTSVFVWSILGMTCIGGAARTE
ncbi:MAG: hypothetical protein ACC645_13860 [Pirellulales bacterium]